MQKQYLAFAFFAAAILFSMLREWSAPVACVRTVTDRIDVISLRQ